MGKSPKIFTNAYGQAGGALTVSLTVKYPFFYDFPQPINGIDVT